MITVFGSINADFILAVEQFPTPKETVLTPSYVIKVGGKGANQAAAAALMGREVMMFGSIGKDDLGAFAQNQIKQRGVKVENILAIDEPTAVAIVMVDHRGENSIVVASGANLWTRADSVPDSAVDRDKILILQMEIKSDENFKLLRRAKKLGCRTILNLAPAHKIPLEVLPLIDYLVVNEIEAVQLARSLAIDAQELTDLLKALAKLSRGVCIATLGEQGALAVKGNEIIKVLPLKIKPVDTTGAGDAFVGILASALDEQLALKDALQRAVIGASLACLKMGAQESLPTKDELLTKISENS